MSKGTTNRASWTAFVLLALGCGGRAENQGSAGVGGSDAASGSPGVAVAGSSAGGTPGVGPIDATGLPTQLPTDCPDMTPPPQLALPCKVGMSLTSGNGPGSISVLECYDLAGETAPPSSPAPPVLSTTIPFGALPTMLNQPVQIPFASLPQVLPSGPVYGLTGTVIFTQVDPVGRAFVARLTGGKLAGCTIPDTPFWAVKGDFE